MRPDFALTLTEDGIGLLHRAKGGWRSLGEVSLDDPGLAETLRLMHQTAAALADGPLLTKLVIPDSQILYTTQPLQGQSDAEKRAGLRRSLDGLTPYALNDLVFDWTDDGQTARIAVVARETLREAEEFARQHAFNPVCFAAAPREAGLFEGEPFFGASTMAGELLDKGERPKADTHSARPGPDPRAAPKAAPGNAATVAASAPPAPAQQPKAVTFTSRRSEAQPTPPTAPATAQPEATAPRRLDLAAASDPSKATPAASAAVTPPPLADPKAVKPPPAPAPASAQARDAMEGALQRAKSGLARARDTAATPARRHAQGPTPTAPQAAANADNRNAATAIASQARGVVSQALRRARTGVETGLDLVKQKTAKGDAASPGPTATTQPKAPRLTALPMAPAQTAKAAPRDLAPAAKSTSDDPMARSDAPGAAIAPDGPKARSVFGAPLTGLSRTMDPRLRQGLMAGAGLFVFVGIVGLWALLFTGDQGGGSPDSIAAIPPETALPDLAPITAPASQPTLSPDEAAEAYAATGLWQRAPEPPTAPAEDRIDDLYLSTPDAAIRPPQKVSLPDAAVQRGNDLALALQINPPGAGQFFDLDDRGLVAATPEGALTPQGIVVTAGPPALLPPPRPEGLVPPLPDTVVMASSVATATRLAPFRPRIRPDGFAPVLAPREAEAPEAETPEELPEGPTLRPLNRPETLAPAPDATPDAPPAETPAAPPADEAANDPEAGPASALALVRSLQPATRPAGLAEKVVALAPAVPAAAVATAPAIPTTASVAKQATVSNAIDLRRLSLIGVYGSDSDRRALVRLPSGRYVKVQVGDRVDGGQVAAIGEDNLRYVKGGRSIKLDLPGG